MKKTLLPLLILTSSLTLASVAKSETQNTSGLYLGAGSGSFTYDVEQDWDSALGYGELIEQTDGNTLKVYAGYQFSRVFALEVTYSDYGDTQGYINTLGGTQTVEQSPTSVSLAANLGYTFATGLRPFALIGLSVLDLNSSFVYLDTDTPSAIKYGVGVEYAPAMLKGVQLRVAYEADSYFAEAYDGWGQESNVDTFTLSSLYAGVSYKF